MPRNLQAASYAEPPTEENSSRHDAPVTDRQDEEEPLIVPVPGEQPLQPRLYKMRWLALLQYSLLYGGPMMQWVTFSITFKQAKEFFNMSTADVNMTVTIFEIVFCVTVPIVMYLFERLGLRGALRVASVCNVLGVGLRFVAGVQPHFAWVLVSQIMLAAVTVFTSPIPAVIASTWFGDHERTMATTICTVAGFAGLALGELLPPIFVTEGHHGQEAWMVLFIIQGAYTVFEFILVFFVIPTGPATPPSMAELIKQQQPATAAAAAVPSHAIDEKPWVVVKKSSSGSDDLSDAMPSPHGSRDSLAHRRYTAESRRSTIVEEVAEHLPMWQQCKRLLRIKALTGLIVAMACVFGIQYGVLALLPQLLQPFGFSESTVGQMGFFSTIAGAVVSIPCSRVIDRYRKYKEPLTVILLACTVLYTAMVLAMYFEPNGLVTLIFVVYAVLGIAQATAMPLCFEYALELSYPYDPLIPAMTLMMAGNGLSVPLMFGLPAMIGSTPTKSTAMAAMAAPAIMSLLCTALVAVPTATLKRLEFEQACATLAAPDDEEPSAAQHVATSPSRNSSRTARSRSSTD